MGMNGGNTKYTKNSEKYVSGTLGEWSMKPKKSRVKGYGNPEPTLKTYVLFNTFSHLCHSCAHIYVMRWKCVVELFLGCASAQRYNGLLKCISESSFP